jgi:VIT1/CCC1 family predicted Fe2+/Mn2+ transporter
MLKPEDRLALNPFFRKRGRIPVTVEQQELEKKRSIRELVFGLQDGTLSTLGFMVGFDATGHDPFVGALIGALTGMISMGVGEYLGGRAEAHVIAATIAEEERLFRERPEEEFAEQVEFLKTKGFSEDEARAFTRILAQNPEVWLHEMLRDEYAITSDEADSSTAVKNGLIMGLAFAIGALGPTFVWGLTHMMLMVGLFAGLTLGLVGYVSGRVSSQNPWKKAFELVMAGALLFAITDMAGPILMKIF